MTGRFFQDGPAPDSNYLACRDHTTKREDRDRVEEMWKRYAPYCPDKDFLDKARKNFAGTTWQMYVACAFMHAGLELEPTRSKGPDIRTRVGERTTWVEAVTASAGTGPDAVQNRNERGSRQGNTWLGRMPSEESVILRCTNAIDEKLRTYERYREKNFVDSDDAFVIALNIGAIEDADVVEPLMPIAFKAVLPVGEFGWQVTIGSDSEPKPMFAHRTEVTKQSQEAVSTRLFLQERAGGISALLSSEVMVWNAPGEYGRDFDILHNPLALIPLEPGALPCGTEWRADGGRLRQVAGEPYFSG